jgi:fructose-specific phosphotransferase system IIC component
MRGFMSFLILPILALVFLFVYFSFVNPKALIEFARWLEKFF